MTVAYLDGEFRQLDDIRISPLDRGLLFVGGVYEVIPAYVGRLFRAPALYAVTRPDIRWTRCDIKSVALLANVLMRGGVD